jgi:hypothetical protein
MQKFNLKVVNIIISSSQNIYFFNFCNYPYTSRLSSLLARSEVSHWNSAQRPCVQNVTITGQCSRECHETTRGEVSDMFCDTLVREIELVSNNSLPNLVTWYVGHWNKETAIHWSKFLNLYFSNTEPTVPWSDRNQTRFQERFLLWVLFREAVWDSLQLTKRWMA